MEREVMLTGMFKSFEELEEMLTVEELSELLKAKQEEEYRNWKFAAGLKGINLDEDSQSEDKASFNRAKRRADAKVKAMADGLSEEQIAESVNTAEFSEFGITITKE